MRLLKSFCAGPALAASLLLSACVATVRHSRPAGDYVPPPANLPGQLRETVTELSGRIGERNCYRPCNLERASAYIERELRRAGWNPRRESFTVCQPQRFLLPCQIHGPAPHAARADCAGPVVWNIIAERRGRTRPEEIVVVGAHYDTKVATLGWKSHGPPLTAQRGTPGANDNGSGVACVLALARLLNNTSLDRTVRLCLWVNEEPPFYQTEGKTSAMGSYVHAMRADEHHENLTAVISAETMGCYSQRSQEKRAGLLGVLAAIAGLPPRHDYIAFQSNIPSGPLARQCADSFSQYARLTVRTSAIITPFKRAAWSDDWSFWQFHYPAFAATDTAYFRSDDYHETEDKPEKLDYAPFADAVWGLKHVVRDLAIAACESSGG